MREELVELSIRSLLARTSTSAQNSIISLKSSDMSLRGTKEELSVMNKMLASLLCILREHFIGKSSN